MSKTLRTQSKETSTKHLNNSRTIFLRLVELVRSLDVARVEELRAAPRLRRIGSVDREAFDWIITIDPKGFKNL